MPIAYNGTAPTNWPDEHRTCQPWADTTQLPCADLLIPPTTGNPDPWTATQYLAMATEIMHAATAAYWPGVCTQTIWRRNPNPGCLSTGSCGCAQLPSIPLAGVYPIGAVLNVSERDVTGAVTATVPTVAYRLDDYTNLVRTDGRGWAACQTSIEVVYGRPVPDTCQRAVAELACELIRVHRNDQKSCIPRGATSISANGQSIDIAPLKEAMAQGRIPLPFCQLCISLATAERFNTAVWSPDLDGDGTPDRSNSYWGGM